MKDLVSSIRVSNTLGSEEWFQGLRGAVASRTGEPRMLEEILDEVLAALAPFFRPEISAEQRMRWVAGWLAFKLNLVGPGAVHPELLDALR